MATFTNYKNLTAALFLLLLVSCLNKTIEGNELNYIGFYSTDEEIIKNLEKGKGGYQENFLLGQAYKDRKDYKKSIFYFVNSCFTSHQSKNIKLYPYPVYKFIKGFHFKSELYNDAVYEIADLFYKYREFKYVIKFIELMSRDNSALYRDAILLKSKALADINKFDIAVSELENILGEYEDKSSRSIIHIRLASIYEKMKKYNDAIEEYLNVIKTDEKSWHSGISMKRILEISGKNSIKLNDEDKLYTAKALYFHSRYSESIHYLSALTKSSSKIKEEAENYIIRSFIRLKKIGECDSLIELYKNNEDKYHSLLMLKADELWSSRKRNEAFNVYKLLLNSGETSIASLALKRAALFSEKGKLDGYKNYLIKYINKYREDSVSEYFLWLLAKDHLKKNDTSGAKPFLEESLKKFPDGKYSDRSRFWLNKIYNFEKNYTEALKTEMELIVNNPDSSYTWTLMEKISNKYKINELQDKFETSLDKKERLEILYYHTLLFLYEKDIDKRNKRLKKISSLSLIKDYQEFEKAIIDCDLDTKYSGLLEKTEKYFKIGHQKAIEKELDLLPDDNLNNTDKYLALSNYGMKYKNYYLTAWATIQLLKLKNIKENISLHSMEIIKRLFPQSFKTIVNNACRKYKIDRNLVFAVIKAESLFNHQAVSSAGATGLMQLMPPTARGIARELNIKNYDLKDPFTSINFGTKYLAWLDKFFKSDFTGIMGGYNAGAGNILKWEKKLNYIDTDFFVEFIPFEETRYYILRTKKFLVQYKIVYREDI